jgi:hypothetical protein
MAEAAKQHGRKADMAKDSFEPRHLPSLRGSRWNWQQIQRLSRFHFYIYVAEQVYGAVLSLTLNEIAHIFMVSFNIGAAK